MDPASGMVYALISRGATAAQGPYVLQRTALRTGTRCRGRTFPVDDLTIASGYLWISGFPGSTTRPVIFQVNPSSLAVVRSIRPPAVPAVATGSHVPVTAGPGGTVWAGWFRTLLRLNAATGATEATAALPPGLAVSDLSADPASNHLYVVAARVTKDGEEGAAVAEYDAQSGHRLALTTRDPLGFSVVGGAASAAPGAVAVSFRTGMMGLTVLLGAKDLAVITLPHTGAQAGRSDDIFHWAMSASTAYGGGALWLMNENGIVACVDPATGRIRAREHVPLSGTAPRILAVDQSSIVTLGPRGLVRITPPRPCWAASA